MLEIKQYTLSRAVQKPTQTSDQPRTMFPTGAGRMSEDVLNSRQSILGSRNRGGISDSSRPDLIVTNDISNFAEIEQASVHLVAWKNM